MIRKTKNFDIYGLGYITCKVNCFSHFFAHKSSLTNFADDTQSCIVCDSQEEMKKIAQKESTEVVSFFKGINLVNNATKASILYNSKGKSETITIENIGGATITSKHSEKLLGLNMAAS